MLPLATAGMAMLPGLIRTGREIAGGLADARAVQQANMPAPDAMANQNQFLGQMQGGGIYDPDGQYQNRIRQNALTNTVQQANLANRQADQGVKRAYVVDTYRGAQDMAMAGIDNYLQMQRDGANNLARMATAYAPR